jgi:hypothetical protein
VKKNINNFRKILVEENENHSKSVITVYFVLRFLVILCMVLEFIRGDWNNAFLCLLSLILFLMPFFIEKKFKIDLPNALEIIILLFIFSAEILGEINNFYAIIPHWDTMLHTINGFLCGAVGFSLVDLLNRNIKSINLSPLFILIVSFCFSMTIGVLWEFFEYASDNSFLNLDMQKDTIVSKISSVKLNENKDNIPIIIDDIEYTIIYSKDDKGNIIETKIDNGYLDIGLNDTIKDLGVNFIGALVFSLFGYLYILNRDKYNFINNFIPIGRT